VPHCIRRFSGLLASSCDAQRQLVCFPGPATTFRICDRFRYSNRIRNRNSCRYRYAYDFRDGQLSWTQRAVNVRETDWHWAGQNKTNTSFFCTWPEDNARKQNPIAIVNATMIMKSSQRKLHKALSDFQKGHWRKAFVSLFRGCASKTCVSN